MTPDVNVLVAASRSDHPHHGCALDWLNQALADCARGRDLHLLPMVIAGFMRLVTHPKVFPDPTPIDRAVEFVEALLDHAGVTVPTLGSEQPVLRTLCLEHGLTGNRIPDAWIAAVVIVNGSHLVTLDRGFGGMLGTRSLTVLNPE